MNDNQIIYMGVNAPRIHQAIIGRLIYWLTGLYLKNQTELIAYPEAMIDESTTSRNDGPPVPDVMLVNHDTDLTEVIIEITHTQGVPKDIEKLKNLMQVYRVGEGFVYDYKQKRWHKFRLGGPETGEVSAFAMPSGRIYRLLCCNVSPKNQRVPFAIRRKLSALAFAAFARYRRSLGIASAMSA